MNYKFPEREQIKYVHNFISKVTGKKVKEYKPILKLKKKAQNEI